MTPEMMTIGCPTTDGWRCAERQADGSVVFFSIGPAERAAVLQKWPDWTWTQIVRRVPPELTMGGRGPGVEFDLRGTGSQSPDCPGAIGGVRRPAIRRGADDYCDRTSSRRAGSGPAGGERKLPLTPFCTHV